MRRRIVGWIGAALGVVLLVTGCISFGNLRPIASFTATPDHGATPLSVEFDASASSDPDGTIDRYFWDFGDGQTGSETLPTVIHVYTNTQSDSKVYTAILVVTDNDDAQDTTVKNITVDP